jgi:hypothetical protein
MPKTATAKEPIEACHAVDENEDAETNFQSQLLQF